MDWQYSYYSEIDPEAVRNFPFERPRDAQLETISEIRKAITKGYRYIVLEAGTGTGKSAIAATLANMSESSYILTVTKQLQDQYLKDFKNFKLVKGRSNFPCKSYLEENVHQSCEEGKCIVEGFNCPYSMKNENPPTCHYYAQKYDALNAKNVIANYHYMFLELNYVEDFTKRELLICDEAHNLSAYITELSKIENLNKPVLLEKISALKQKISDCNRFVENINYDPDSWIIDYDEEFETLEFKPVKVDSYAVNTLFDFADVSLFMSATILDYELFAKWLGIDPSEIYAIRRKTPFDNARNPIIVSNEYNLSKSYIRLNAPKTIELLEDILSSHENEKGIIHTVSSECMCFIMDNVRSDRLIAHNTKNRSEILEEFKRSDEALVLVSPSMDEGVDLPGDECRFQIVYKIPYPDLGSKQVKSRIALDEEWYDYKTSLRLVQTHGRGMRFEDDYCKTYFIDNRLRNYVLTSKFIPEDLKELVRSKADIKEGLDYLNNSDYENAIRFFKGLVKEDADDFRVYLYLSRAYHESDLYEEELQVIFRYLSKYPKDYGHFKSSLEVLDSMGYFDLGQYQKF